DGVEMERLVNPRNHLTIRYSSLHGIFVGVPEEQRAALQRVEQTFQVALLYGVRQFDGHPHEVLLVDVTNPNLQQISSFKFYVWQYYGLNCGRYEWNSEFNQYFTIAPPL